MYTCMRLHLRGVVEPVEPERRGQQHAVAEAQRLEARVEPAEAAGGGGGHEQGELRLEEQHRRARDQVGHQHVPPVYMPCTCHTREGMHVGACTGACTHGVGRQHGPQQVGERRRLRVKVGHLGEGEGRRGKVREGE